MAGMKKYKSIRVMADFSSSGIWNGYDTKRDRGLMIEYEDLDLPPKIRLLFIDWIELYEECWDKGYTKMDKKKCSLMNKRGLKLAKMLKKLWPDKKITYWGETYNCNRGDQVEV